MKIYTKLHVITSGPKRVIFNEGTGEFLYS